MSIPVDSVDAENFRSALRRWATGVTIVTAHHAGIQHGMTVSSFTSISLEPPLILVSLEQGAKTTQLIHDSSMFAVTILGEDQQMISERFAGRLPEFKDRFDGLELVVLKSGAPVLAGGLAGFDCSVVSTHNFGTHTLFIGEVVDLNLGANVNPLIYFGRNYHHVDR